MSLLNMYNFIYFIGTYKRGRNNRRGERESDEGEIEGGLGDRERNIVEQ